MSVNTSETDRPSWAQFRSDYAAEIEDMAEVLADEWGTHLHLLVPDERTYIMALATRAVKHAIAHYDAIETDVDEKLADAEDRIATAAAELRVLISTPADKLMAAVEHAIGTLTADNS